MVFFCLRSGDVTCAVARMPSPCPDGLRVVSQKTGKSVTGPVYARILGECKMWFRAPRADGTESDCSFQRRCLRVFEGRGGLKWTSWEVLCARRRACGSISDLLKKVHFGGPRGSLWSCENPGDAYLDPRYLVPGELIFRNAVFCMQ